MRLENLGGYKDIDAFVRHKLSLLRGAGECFEDIFPLMFGEKENILWEESRGYRIVKLTYGEAYERSIALSEKATELFSSLEHDSVIGIAAENGPFFIEMLWAILRAGFRPLLVNTRLGRPLLEKALSEVGIAALVTDGSSVPGGDVIAGCKAVTEETLSACPGKEPQGSFGSAVLVMSSGTSMNVKCCGYTAKEIKAQLLDSAEIIGKSRLIKKHYNGELKLLALLPFCHIFGLTAVYMWFSLYSRTFVRLGDLSPSTVQNTIKRHKVTHIFAVPLFWEKTYAAAMAEISSRGEKTLAKFGKGLAVARKLDFCPPLASAFRKAAFGEVREGLFGESVAFMITGGAGIKPEVLEFFNGIGYRLANGYGMTETGITSVELSDRFDIICSGSAGLPLPSAAYSLTPEGELLSSGSSRAAYTVCGGKRTERGESFETRDLARIGKDGRLYLLGRSDELVIGPGGENLNPNIIEPLFAGLGAREVCLCGVDRDGVTQPVLAVSVNGYLTPEGASAIRDAVAAEIASAGLSGLIGDIYITPSPLVGADDFKLNRRKIAQRISDGSVPRFSFETRNPAAENTELYSKIRDAFVSVLRLNSEPAAGADFFTDCGGTSFEYAALTALLSEELEISFPPSAEGLSSIKEIYEYSEKAIEKLG